MSSLRNDYSRITNSELGVLIRPVSIDGTLGGDTDMMVDGSSVPVKFWVQPLPTTRFIITQASIEISDNGNPELDDYGSVMGPIPNGLQFFTEIDGVENLFPTPLKSNSEIIQLFPDIVIVPFQGSVMLRTHSFDGLEHSHSFIELNGNTNDKFGVIIQDDFTTLTCHSVGVKGNIRAVNV